jgi:hypothetical protein
MLRPLNNILSKVFAEGFYKANAGIFIVVLLILIAPGAGVIKFHQSLMLYLVAKPLAMMIAFAVLLLYTFKCWHYVLSTISAVHQQFLFYSLNSFSRFEQILAWAILQATISLPPLIYMLCSIILAIKNHYYFSACLIIIYLMGLLLLSASLYYWRINKLIDGGNQSIGLKLTNGFKKPLFLLYIYHVFDQLKTRYLIVKLLSYLVVIGVFSMFADVKMDVRVGGIAMLAIAVTHAMLIFEEREFDGTFLMFAKTLPRSRFEIFMSQLCMYSILLLPEAFWLICNLPIMISAGLFLFCISIIMLFVSSLHVIGCNQERYLLVVLGLFFLIFFVILYQFVWALTVINFVLSYCVFYLYYYRFKGESGTG